MKNILGSSRRVAMLILVVTTCAAFLLGKISPELFMGLVTTVASFFFGQRSAEKASEAVEQPKQ